MKAIQITMDEGLLRDFDADEEVRKRGRSAVFRGFAREYLRRRRERRIKEEYARAGAEDGGREPEWEGWEYQSVLPPWEEEGSAREPAE